MRFSSVNLLFFLSIFDEAAAAQVDNDADNDDGDGGDATLANDADHQ